MKTIGRLNSANGGRLIDIEIPESILANLPPKEYGFVWVSKIKGLPIELRQRFNMIYIPTHNRGGNERKHGNPQENSPN